MSSIPPAPPLPLDQSSRVQQQPARSAFARFVTPFSRPTQVNRQEGGKSNPPYNQKLPVTSPWTRSSQHSSLKIRDATEITALDQNRERTHAVVAGRNTLQTIRVDGTTLKEDANIRQSLAGHERPNAAQMIDIRDVKWSHGHFNSLIATAASNGKVVIYDLNRPGIELARLHEHTRQVHKLAFSPFLGHLLLSASQDGTVLLWDLRDVRDSVVKCSSREKYKGQSDGVRDVKWSPTDALEFAFATDSGVIQKWEYRNPKGPKLRINAHDKHCSAIDWHPDGKHLMSAGHDMYVKIWDFNSEVRRQKPQWVIRTPFPIMNARWRPEHWFPEDRGAGSWQCAQIVTSYDRVSSTDVHLWDFRRPYMPFREISFWQSAPTDMLWHDQRLLWTVGREGTFQQTDVQFSPKVIDRRPMQAFAISPTGEICVFSQKRPPRQKAADVDRSQATVNVETEFSEYPSERELSRSFADDTPDENFLSSSYKRGQVRTTSTRSTKSAASTPPSFHDSDMRKVVKLSDALAQQQDQAMSRAQTGYRAMLEGTLNAQAFTYLAQKYKTAAIPTNPTVGSFLSIERVFEQNAAYAQKVGSYRVSQTWRIFSEVLGHDLKQRATENRRRRLLPPKADDTPIEGKEIQTDEPIGLDISHPSDDPPSNSAIEAIPANDNSPTLLGTENSSNVPTPLAQPHSNEHTQQDDNANLLPNPDQESLELPPSVVERNNSLDEEPPISSAAKDFANAPAPEESLEIPSSTVEKDESLHRESPSISSPAGNSANAPVFQESIEIPPSVVEKNESLDREPPPISSAARDVANEPVSEESLELPLSAVEKNELPNEQSQSTSSPGRDFANAPVFQESEWHLTASEINARKAQMSNWKAAPKQPFELDLPSTSPVTIPQPRLGRQDSDESFGMLSASSGSQPLGTSAPSFIARTHRPSMSKIPESSDHGSVDDSQFFGPPTSLKEPVGLQSDLPKGQSSWITSSSSMDFGNRGLATSTHHDGNEHIDMSKTIVPDDSRIIQERPVTNSQEPLTEDYILSDFTSIMENHSLDPLTAQSMLCEIYEYYTKRSPNPQTVYHLSTILKPFLEPPQLPDISNSVETLESQATPLPKPTNGISALQAEAVISTYNDLLQRHQLFNPSASLAREAFEDHEGLFNTANCTIGLICMSCKSPINNPVTKLRCEHCRKRQSPCPICWQKYPAFEGSRKSRKAAIKAALWDRESRADSGAAADDQAAAISPDLRSSAPAPATEEQPAKTTAPTADDAEDPLFNDNASTAETAAQTNYPVLWQSCLICGHGAHAACIQHLQSDPDYGGKCVTEGCLCDCIAGTYRARLNREAEELRRVASAGLVVRGDSKSVPESRAVRSTRGLLDAAAGREAKGEEKRVRVVEPKKG